MLCLQDSALKTDKLIRSINVLTLKKQLNVEHLLTRPTKNKKNSNAEVPGTSVAPSGEGEKTTATHKEKICFSDEVYIYLIESFFFFFLFF